MIEFTALICVTIAIFCVNIYIKLQRIEEKLGCTKSVPHSHSIERKLKDESHLIQKSKESIHNSIVTKIKSAYQIRKEKEFGEFPKLARELASGKTLDEIESPKIRKEKIINYVEEE